MIKNRLQFYLSVILLLVALFFVSKRLAFLSHAEKADGAVEGLTAVDTICRKKRGRHSSSSYECTKYTASIGFVTRDGRSGSFSVVAGSARGHNQPVSAASFHQGERVRVVYNPNNLSEVYCDAFMHLWGRPFMISIFAVVTMVGSCFDSRSRLRIKV